MPAPFWRAVWRKRPWMKRLSGVTCERSMLDRGVTLWISSLRATPASRSASRGGAPVQMTLDICGLTSPVSLPSASPRSASSKTSPVICLSEHTSSSKNFKAWASALRAHCGRRRKSARIIAESDYSSLLPTPTASRYGSNQGGMGGRTGAKRQSLEMMASRGLLPTPSASHCESRPPATFNAKNQSSRSLGAMARHGMLPTPLASNGGGNPRRGNPKLTTMASQGLLPTPTPTPTVTGNHNRKGASPANGDGLSTAVGGPLNPEFVEWMLGWPIGWSDCASAATGSSPNKPKPRSSNASKRSGLEPSA